MELRIDRVTKKYGNKLAVDRISTAMDYGVYGLLGANGAGKTTLMRMICDIQTPTMGEILLEGTPIRDMGEAYRDLLGYLPQNFGYYPDFTAWRFMLYIGALKGLPKAAAKEKSMGLLQEVGLWEIRNKKIKTFSGGMKQRLGIAQAMLNNPRILVLDEPTAGLDPKERVRFRNLISAMAQNRLVLFSTHIVSDVEYISRKIFVMKEGQIIHEGSPGEVRKAAEGKVWECTVTAAEADVMARKFNVGNLRNTEDGNVLLRIIQEERPTADARQAEPVLEDVYLYYFRE